MYFVCAIRVTNIKCVCKSLNTYEHVLCTQVVSQMCHKYECILCVQFMSQKWDVLASLSTNMTKECDMTHSWVWHDSFTHIYITYFVYASCVTNVSQKWDVLASLSTNMNIFLCAQILLSIWICFVYATRVSSITCEFASRVTNANLFLCAQIVSQIWIYFCVRKSWRKYEYILVCATRVIDIECVCKSRHKYESILCVQFM